MISELELEYMNEFNAELLVRENSGMLKYAR
jgi:hypothetical protein